MEMSSEQPAVEDNFIGGYILGKIFFSFVKTLCPPHSPLQKYFQNEKTENSPKVFPKQKVRMLCTPHPIYGKNKKGDSFYRIPTH
jgi:hypothetical protein